MHPAPPNMPAPRGALSPLTRLAASSGAALLLALACCGEPQVDASSGAQDPNKATQQPNGTADIPGNGNLATSGGNLDMPATGGNETNPNNGNLPVVTSPNVSPALAMRFIGRVQASAPVFSWPANAVEIAFKGTTGAFHFNAQGNVRMGLSVDGVPQAPTLLQTGVPLSFGPLAAGNHVVRATMLSEGRLGTATYLNYETDGAPVVLPIPSRRIEFIGDSIVAGYGVDGNAPCNNNVRTEDANSSFAALTARAVQADYTVLAWAGKGVVRNDITDTNNTQLTMAQMWSQQTSVASANYTFPPEAAPQAVVIALGTNDYEYTKDVSGTATQVRPPMDASTMQGALLGLVNDVKLRYPAAKVVLCTSPLLNDDYPPSVNQHSAFLADVQAVKSQFPNGDVVMVDLPALNSAQKSGCNGHPNRASHAILSAALLPVLKQAIGW